MKTVLFVTSFVLLFFSFKEGKTQYLTLTGFVNAKSGEVLENVSIYDSLSTIGSLTDKRGFYQLLLVPGKINLSATLSGFEVYRKSFTLSCDTMIVINLTPLNEPKDVAKKEEPRVSVKQHSIDRRGVSSNLNKKYFVTTDFQ